MEEDKGSTTTGIDWMDIFHSMESLGIPEDDVREAIKKAILARAAPVEPKQYSPEEKAINDHYMAMQRKKDMNDWRIKMLTREEISRQSKDEIFARQVRAWRNNKEPDKPLTNKEKDEYQKIISPTIGEESTREIERRPPLFEYKINEHDTFRYFALSGGTLWEIKGPDGDIKKFRFTPKNQ